VLGDIALDALRDRMLVLRTMPQFAALDEEDLMLLAERAHLVHAPAGSVLFREGAALDRVFLLAEGSVRVTRGSRQVLLDEGGEIGLLPLFAGRELAPAALVVRDATLLELPAEVVLSSFYDSVSIARNTIRLAAQALLERRDHLPPRTDDSEVVVGTWHDRTPTLVEKMLLMRRSAVWARANLDAIAEVARHIEELRLDPGTQLWDIGEHATHSLRIEYGIIACTNARGETVRVGGGHMVGGLDALASVGHSYRAVTETKAILFRISAATQIAVLEVHPQIAARLRSELSRALLEEQEAADSAQP